ncbi:MAG: DUF423 domain-containing protein [Gammaproteobacteria bacterium]|jgi:uncharacterized membrane protein YgdD (TMEM256/DUF423 family)|nr:DUF423 domain-containing protein [Gammaproteobacteria bacterium]
MLAYRIFLVSGALGAALAVVAGAFGAHALRGIDPASLSVYRLAVDYQFWHALGLLAAGLAGMHFGPRRSIVAAGSLMIIGIVLFSGSLYGMSLLGMRLGMVTPLGGLAFILAWLFLAWGIGRAGPLRT